VRTESTPSCGRADTNDPARSHTAHRLLALWTLGGNGALIEAAYEQDKKSQRDAYKSPAAITTENFNKHLGDEE
jgi:hypothetical protein